MFWRPNNGKFRWVLKDLDFGFGLDRGFSGDTAANSTFYILNPGVNPNAWAYNETNTFMFRRVLADKDSSIKQMFVDYYMVTLGDLLREDIITSMTDSLAANIRTEYPFHASRWDGPERYTAPYYRSEKSLTPENWEKEITWIKRWAGARIRNVYDSLSAQFKLGSLQPLEVTTSTGDTSVILMNSIKVHYPSFNGKWPIGRPLALSVADSANGYQFKRWEVTTISGSNDSDTEYFTDRTLDITDLITKNSTKTLARAILEKIPGETGLDASQKKLNSRLKISHDVAKNELIINAYSTIKTPLKVELFDLRGTCLRASQMESNVLRLDLSGSSSRLMILSVANGGERQTFKVLSK